MGGQKGEGGLFFLEFFFSVIVSDFRYFYLLKDFFFVVLFCSKFKKHKKSSMIEKKTV